MGSNPAKLPAYYEGSPAVGDVLIWDGSKFALGPPATGGATHDFVFDAAAPQSGNVYNSVPDLYTAMSAVQGAKRLWIESTMTVASGETLYLDKTLVYGNLNDSLVTMDPGSAWEGRPGGFVNTYFEYFGDNVTPLVTISGNGGGGGGFIPATSADIYFGGIVFFDCDTPIMAFDQLAFTTISGLAIVLGFGPVFVVPDGEEASFTGRISNLDGGNDTFSALGPPKAGSGIEITFDDSLNADTLEPFTDNDFVSQGWAFATITNLVSTYTFQDLYEENPNNIAFTDFSGGMEWDTAALSSFNIPLTIDVNGGDTSTFIRLIGKGPSLDFIGSHSLRFDDETRTMGWMGTSLYNANSPRLNMMTWDVTGGSVDSAHLNFETGVMEGGDANTESGQIRFRTGDRVAAAGVLNAKSGSFSVVTGLMEGQPDSESGSVTLQSGSVSGTAVLQSPISGTASLRTGQSTHVSGDALLGTGNVTGSLQERSGDAIVFTGVSFNAPGTDTGDVILRSGTTDAAPGHTSGSVIVDIGNTDSGPEGSLWVQTDEAKQIKLRFREDVQSGAPPYVGIGAPAGGGDNSDYNLPSTRGSVGQVLAIASISGDTIETEWITP